MHKKNVVQHRIGKMRGEGKVELFVKFIRRCFFVLIFFLI